MATFIYNGEDERVFPTISVTVKGGDSFEAPDDFTAPNVAPKSTKAKPAPTVGDE
jgi:hypothetical protein